MTVILGKYHERGWTLLLLTLLYLFVCKCPVQAAPSLTQIRHSIHQSEQAGASIGVYIVDLSRGKTLLQYHERRSFLAASVIKLCILGTVYWLHGQGKFPLTPTRLADLRDMIGVSDNDAANRLLARCGKERIHHFLVGPMGFHATHLVHLLDQPPPPGVGYNVTTPYEAAHLLDHLLFDKMFAPYQQNIRSFFIQARWHQPIWLVRYLPQAIPCYRKPGRTSYVINDVVYIDNPKTGRRLLASFFSNYGSLERNRELSEQISRYLAAELSR